VDTITLYDAFFAGNPKEWALCEALRRALTEKWPDTAIRVMKTCISFDDPKPYCYVSHPPRKDIYGIWLSISLLEKMEHPRFSMVVPVSKSRFTVHIAVKDETQVDEELIDLIVLSHR